MSPESPPDHERGHLASNYEPKSPVYTTQHDHTEEKDKGDSMPELETPREVPSPQLEETRQEEDTNHCDISMDKNADKDHFLDKDRENPL